MKRVLVAGALVAGAVTFAAPASAIKCPPGTEPRPLPTGHTACAVVVYCDPGPCKPFDRVECPYDVPVWSGVCRAVFGG